MSTQNQSPLQQPPIPNSTSIHSDISEDHSARFSASPPSSHQLWNSPDSRPQTHPHLGEDKQSAIPLLHHKTGLPITVFIDPSLPSPPASHPFIEDQLGSHPHPNVIPATQASNTEHHHRLSPSSIVQNASLPELPLHLLPQAEDEFDQERLEQVVERLRDANDRMSAEAPQHAGDSNATAVGTGIDGASTRAHKKITSGVLSTEDQDGVGPRDVFSMKEMVNQEQNHEEGIDCGENAHRSMEEFDTQGCSGDTVGSQNPTNEDYLPWETVKEEPEPEQVEGALRHEQSGLIEQEDGIGVHEEIIPQPSGVADAVGSPYDPSRAQSQREESPATSDRDQSRGTSRKRRRGEIETGYWLRSRKPPSSSKRSRRTNYWLRP